MDVLVFINNININKIEMIKNIMLKTLRYANPFFFMGRGITLLLMEKMLKCIGSLCFTSGERFY